MLNVRDAGGDMSDSSDIIIRQIYLIRLHTTQHHRGDIFESPPQPSNHPHRTRYGKEHIYINHSSSSHIPPSNYLNKQPSHHPTIQQVNHTTIQPSNHPTFKPSNVQPCIQRSNFQTIQHLTIQISYHPTFKPSNIQLSDHPTIQPSRKSNHPTVFISHHTMLPYYQLINGCPL